MKLSSIPSGTSVFIDANIFLYDVFDDPDVLDEVLFKMILMEASNKLDVSTKNVVGLLKKEPEKLAALEKSWENIRRIQNMENLTIFGSHEFL